MRIIRTIPAKLVAAPILLTALLCASSFAQDPAATVTEVELATTAIEMKCRSDVNKPQQVINNEAELKTLLQERDRELCGEDKHPKIDFQKYTLIFVSVFADCHAEISLRVTKNTEKKSYEVTVSEKYGGCRGMNLHNRGVLVEKLPPDFTVHFKTIEDRKQND